MSLVTTAMLLGLLTAYEAASVGGQVRDRCRCINKEAKPIGRYIAVLEVKPASSHCPEIEIIATLKKDGIKICLDPNAPWLRKVQMKKNAVQTR